MRRQDEVLANAVLKPTFVFMRAQTDKARLDMSGFGAYFEYRERDVGSGYVEFKDMSRNSPGFIEIDEPILKSV